VGSFAKKGTTMIEVLEGREMFSVTLMGADSTNAVQPVSETEAVVVEKARPAEIVIVKKLDKASPVLMQYQ
jgi:hypothetical protein